jgi:hypothetical protein
LCRSHEIYNSTPANRFSCDDLHLHECRFFPDWETRQYKDTFRVDKDTFWFLYQRYGVLLAKKYDGPRPPIPTEKRFAIVMHWLATGSTYLTLANLYNVSKPVVVNILHDAIKAWRYTLVPDAIVFPTGPELADVMRDFEALCCLPHCAGAIDGTFMFHKKPSKYGDSYWCYKHGHAIIVLGVVDARGIFTFVDTGRAGSVGDSVAWQKSAMKGKVDSGEWLDAPPLTLRGVQIKPYLVADAAFAFGPKMMKCYEGEHARGTDKAFLNYAIIRTRRVVETAFGRLKGRFRIMASCNLNNVNLLRQIALICCALHNVCERYSCPFEDGWLPNMVPADDAVVRDNAGAQAGAEAIRSVLGKRAAERLRNMPL